MGPERPRRDLAHRRLWDDAGIDGDRVRLFETTQISRIEAAPGRRVGPGRFRSPLGFFSVRLDRHPDRALFHYDHVVGDRHLYRRQMLPAAPTLPPGPLADFDVFWQTFADQYPFFAAKGIDWNAVRRAYRPRVGTADLYELLTQMLAPLGDAHTGITDGTRQFSGHRPGTAIPTLEMESRIGPFIVRRDLRGVPPAVYANGLISYADLPGRLGYLRPLTFRYTEGIDYAAEVSELDNALDSILTRDRVASLRGLIIDLRINGGGSDALALRMASRLTDRPFFAYAKQARNDVRDATRFTRPQPVWVPETDRPRYARPVVILAGGSTMSAGETFTQAMLNRPQRPVLIGQPTQGVFSDTLQRTLPNGWEFWLPNEQYLDRRGRSYDGTGIPPDITTPVFTDEEFAADRDSAFDRAVSLLAARRRRHS
jgi:Peptidase family S41/Tricorn protease C1 domain